MRVEKKKPSPSRRLAISMLIVLSFLAAQGQAQPYFSVDFQGPTAGGGALAAGDVLVFGGAPPVVPFTAFALAPSPWTGQVEIDALAIRSGALLGPPANPKFDPPMLDIQFTVDEFAAGIATSPAAPNVTSEGATGWREASADIYTFLYTTVPPSPTPVYGNTGFMDGNGIAPFAAPGLGLIERNPPRFGIPDRGDNLDALGYPITLCTPPQTVYFSLDAAWMDPLEGAPVNSGTAAVNGFAPGDIIVYTAGPPSGIALYAPCWQLGLGPQDDVDALILHESGGGQFNPSQTPYDWEVRLGGARLLYGPRHSYGHERRHDRTRAVPTSNA